MKKITPLWVTGLLLFSLSACSVLTQSTTTTQESTTLQQPIVSSDMTTGDSSSTDVEIASEAGLPDSSTAVTIPDISETHEEAEDYVWDSAGVIPITLQGDSIIAENDGVSVNGSIATITSAGTYSLSGTLSDGQIIVDTQDKDIVRLILSDVDLRSSTSAPLYIASAEKVILVLVEGTQNSVSDAASHTFIDPAEVEPNAAVFSKADLTIYGEGSLTVTGNYSDGIASKDGLILASGTLIVNAADDGIRGKDYLVIKAGNITVVAQGDGLKADNEEDATRGFISILSGALNVTSGGDAITAQTAVTVSGGELTLTTAGGSGSWIDESLSAKGIKGLASVTIHSGALTINSADDSIHSNGSVVINGGTFQLASGDDAVHADSTLEVNGGTLKVTSSYEGLESSVITINAGELSIVSSDDGINVASGVDGSGQMPGMDPGRGPGRGQDNFTYTGETFLYINGGTTIIEAAGDGLDVNGAIEMKAGTVIVNGPTQQMNGAVDYDAYFTISGGYLIAAGSAGMAQAPGESSGQYSLLINFDTTLPAGTLVYIQNSTGETMLAFAPSKPFQSIAFSSDGLVTGETYEIYTGGSASGANFSGLYQDGAAAGGDRYASFTVSTALTQIGSVSRRR